METRALNAAPDLSMPGGSMPGGPPPLLEQAVLLLLPPACRETVGGDLCELYRSPLQYGWQALTALPFVILSQARRNANWPVLGLQGLILYACFHGLFAIMGGGGPDHALAATAAGLMLLFIHEAYQEQERPSYRRAILETILLCAMVMLLFPQHFLMGLVAVHKEQVWWPGFALLGSLMALIPVLCCLRAGMILEVDRRHPPLAEEIAADDVPGDYQRFRRQSHLSNQLESGALALAALVYAVLGPRIGMGGGNSVVIGAYAAASLYLMLEAPTRGLAAGGDFRSLRARYQYELARRHQLRRFLCWLWCAPFFLIVYTDLITPGIERGRSSDISWGLLAALLLGFFISALNREGAGPVQEKIALLSRLEQA